MRCRLCPLLLLCLCLAPLAVSADAVVKIMPLGDSITRGDSWTTSPYPSYRYYLDDSLRASGFAVDFVGSTSSAFTKFVFDQQHEGHGGYTTGMLVGTPSVSPLASWLAASPTPEIVLLHIGTNDLRDRIPLATRLENLKQIVGLLRQKNPKVRVMIAQIIPTGSSANNTNGGLLDYNRALPSLAAGLTTAASPVTVVDLHTGYDGVADNQPDGIHPKTSGEKKMAGAWYRALVPVLSATPATTVPTTVPTTAPPAGRPVPGTVEAEDYDTGGEGAGYHDTTPGNHDNVYRHDDVDLSVNPSGGYNVGYVVDGEWLAYTLAVPSAGTYTVSCTVAAWADGRFLGLSLDGSALGTLAVPNNRCSGWRTVSKQVTLPAGSHRLVVRFGGDKQILDRIAVATVATPPTTVATTVPATPGGTVRLPATVQAEHYATGGEGVGYHDTTAGNQGGAYRTDGVDIAYAPSAGSHVVTQIRPGEWLEYSVDAPEERDYSLAFRLSSPSGGQFFEMKVDGRSEVTVIAPRTGSYDAYTTISTQVRLTRGVHRIRIHFYGDGQNFDAFGLS
jgi:lysophospholipase L1-like esterase